MSRSKQILIIVGLIFIALSIYLSTNSSPDNPFLFSLKRAQEKIFQRLQTSDQSQINYKINLLNSRLAELKQILENKQYTYLLDASLRYSTTAGEMTDLILNTNSKENAKTANSLLLEHQTKLQEMINLYPKDLNEEWKYLQDDINYLKIYTDKLSKI